MASRASAVAEAVPSAVGTAQPHGQERGTGMPPTRGNGHRIPCHAHSILHNARRIRCSGTDCAGRVPRSSSGPPSQAHGCPDSVGEPHGHSFRRRAGAEPKATGIGERQLPGLHEIQGPQGMPAPCLPLVPPPGLFSSHPFLAPPPPTLQGSKGRAANGDRPVGAASCRRGQHTMASCQNPPTPPIQ